MSTYPHFVTGLTPYILGLDTAKVALDRLKYWDQVMAQKSKGIERVLESEYEVISREDDHFDLKATFAFTVQMSGKTNGAPALKIECAFYGHFHAQSDASPEHVETFAQSDAWVVFWPYFRQFVSDTTARMSIPPVVIPFAIGPNKVLGAPETDSAEPKKLGKKRTAKKKQ